MMPFRPGLEGKFDPYEALAADDTGRALVYPDPLPPKEERVPQPASTQNRVVAPPQE